MTDTEDLITKQARKEAERRHPSWHDNGIGIVQGSHYRSGFVAGAEWEHSRKVEVTDAMADRAHRAWHEFVWRQSEPPLTDRDLGITRQAWRAALEAALDHPNGSEA